MSIICPFCAGENASVAMVCISCARDITVPVSLIDERNDILRKRDAVREELRMARIELEGLKPSKKRRPV
jgi:hypothetical protein